jgi:hypothetical protein
MRGEKRGEIRPAGTISREGMRAYFWRQNVTKTTLLTTLHSARKEIKGIRKSVLLLQLCSPIFILFCVSQKRAARTVYIVRRHTARRLSPTVEGFPSYTASVE